MKPIGVLLLSLVHLQNGSGRNSKVSPMKCRLRDGTRPCYSRRLLRVSVWNNVLTVGNHVLGEVDIVLSKIDWSKENARDYTFVSIDS